MSEHLIILFALEREAAPFRRLAAGREGIRIAVSGVGAAAARRAAEDLTRHNRTATVIAAGFCGALRSGLGVGTVVAATDVVNGNGSRWACCDTGRPPARLLTTSHLVATPVEKHVFHARFQAEIVDMESAAVAEVCAARGVPFQAIRVVSDAVETALSPRLVKLLSGANVSPSRAALAVVRQPSLIPEFYRLARDTKRAAMHLAAGLMHWVEPRVSRCA